MTDDVIKLAALRDLKDVVGDDPDLLAEFVDVFTRTVPNQIGEMRTALAAKDLTALRIAVHGCKSNARDMGASTLEAHCAKLEDQCRLGQLDTPDAGIEAIESEAKRAIDALNAMDLGRV